jgi:hypothetical protein
MKCMDERVAKTPATDFKRWFDHEKEKKMTWEIRSKREIAA